MLILCRCACCQRCVIRSRSTCPYPKCPPLQLFSARIPCGHLSDVHAEYWNIMSATSARRQKKIIRKREWTSAGIPAGQLCGRSGHLSDILFQYSASAGILCGRPQNVHWTSARMSVRRPPECPSDVHRISVGRPPECPSHLPECPSDVRRMSVRMCRTSARMSNGCLSDFRNVRTEKCL